MRPGSAVVLVPLGFALLLGGTGCATPGAGTYCQSGDKYGTTCHSMSDVSNPPGQGPNRGNREGPGESLLGPPRPGAVPAPPPFPGLGPKPAPTGTSIGTPTPSASAPGPLAAPE